MVLCELAQNNIESGDTMNITVTIEINNSTFESFEKLEEYAQIKSNELGQAIIRSCLETKDMQLMAERDNKRYRCKGLRKTCIKTRCGTVEYSRRVYQDEFAQAGEPKSVYLLDENMGVAKVGNVSPGLCKLVASSVCESTYRAASRQVSELTGQSISAQGAWNIVQQLGQRQKERTERNAALAKKSQGTGTIETKLLYEENDGIWLHLQGKAREEYGRSKEMKVGIAYDGVLWKEDRNGGKRRILNNKIAYSCFDRAKEFRANKEGLVASTFNVDAIELRVINGDGASWIQKQKGINTISVLDAYHRNKKIRECVKDPEKAKLISEVLHEKSTDELLEYLDAAITTVVDDEEREGLQALYDYYSENKDSMKGYYDRGIEIPPTREPGVLHHARLGSMESNIFTLVGNRMKGRRFNWSIQGANNLSSLLCAYHTTGMEGLFAEMPKDPEIIPEWTDDGKPLSAKDSTERVGKGYEYPGAVSTQESPYWLKDIARIGDIDNLKLRF